MAARVAAVGRLFMWLTGKVGVPHFVPPLAGNDLTILDCEDHIKGARPKCWLIVTPSSETAAIFI